jgi:hypothetical protein
MLAFAAAVHCATAPAPADPPDKVSVAGSPAAPGPGEARAADPRAPLVSGRAVGEYVPQFYSRVVSGPLMNRSVCFVCRYGERPVVMVLARQVGPELRPLMKNIDRVVEQHRATGLRSFGVLVSDEAFPAISKVQTFAFNNRVTMPLTVGTEALAVDGGQNLHRDAAVTVVLYHKRTVAARYALRADELDVAHFTPVIERLKTFAAEHAAGTAPVEEADVAE